MSEFKKCPFCGSKPEGFAARDEDIIIMRCSNHDCIASSRSVTGEVWNTRAGIAEEDFPQLELLMRRFCMASQGEPREKAKAAVLNFIAGKDV